PAHHGTVASWAVVDGGDFEIGIWICGVWLRFAQIPFHATGAQHRAGHAEPFAICRRNKPNAPGALHPDAIRGQQLFVFVNLRGDEFQELLYVFFKSLVRFVLASADAKGVSGQARAAILLKNLEDLFPIAESIKKRRDGTDIERMRSQPEHAAGPY